MYLINLVEFIRVKEVMEGSGAAVVQNLTSLTADLLECLNNPSGSEPSSSPPPVSESSVLNYESRIRDHLNSCYEISSENYICDIKNPVEILFSSSNSIFPCQFELG